MPSWTKTRALFCFFQLKHVLQQHADIIGFLKQNALGGERGGGWLKTENESERKMSDFIFFLNKGTGIFCLYSSARMSVFALRTGQGSAGLLSRSRKAVKFVRLVVLDVFFSSIHQLHFLRRLFSNFENNKSFSTYASACCYADMCTHNM